MERKVNYSRFTDRYLDGELKGQEQRWYEDQLTSNSDLEKELELHREVNQAIRQTDVIRFRNQLDEIHASIEPEYNQSFSRKVMQSKYARIAAASVVVIVAMGLFLYNILSKPVDSADLFQRYYEAPVLSITVRSDATMDKLFHDAVIHFNNGQFADALTLFEKVVALDRSNMKAHLATGISQIEVNQTREAEKSFETVINHKDNLYIDEAEWFLALCYLKTNDLDNARVHFDQVAMNDRSNKQEEAQRIVKKLNR